jgi:hypothetical protein
MTRARALLSLSLVTSGAMLGGLSLSGYYEPRTPQSPVVVASSASSKASPGASLAPQGRLRFVAAADEKLGERPAPPAAKPKAPAKAPAAASAPPPKPKAETKERPDPRSKRQHVAAPWPWSIFGD